MDPSIPETYFGNCVRPFIVTTKRSNLLREDGVVVASQLIGEAILRLNKDVLRGQEDGISDLLHLQSGRVFAAAGSPPAGLYGVDYGWGRPKKVEFVSSDRMGCMFMKESHKLDGGMEIDFAFSKKEMVAFASMFNGLRLIFD
ncbi:hypothetical protein NE237_010082 [Protea cynaroides]|uniref:Uncharacterized protein n=1 Tax=Protea cynaroides TaxID=273540 RepID=A0A9Q0R193_9MAGN|nr:hypothetical protein NE237_010082 [Protea cynaroides]